MGDKYREDNYVSWLGSFKSLLLIPTS